MQWEDSIGENIDYGHTDPVGIVVSLVVDDNVPGRGHRKTIFNPKYALVGAALGPHKGYRDMCVMDFAGGERDLSTVLKTDCEIHCSGAVTAELRAAVCSIRAKETPEKLIAGIEKHLASGESVRTTAVEEDISNET